MGKNDFKGKSKFKKKKKEGKISTVPGNNII